MNPLTGNEDLRKRLRDAAISRRLPQSLLLHGPGGVGKQRLGLWLGSLVLCEGVAERRPCGSCRSCRLADSHQHPDLHWFFPVERPKGARTKLREKLEEARLEELERRRDAPLSGMLASPSAAIYLAAVNQMRAIAAKRPAMGSRWVLLVGDADRMVPQAANPEAANAFLKLLEEPPEDALIILTSSRPGSLLSTIRSRVLAVRVLPLSAEEIADYLVAEAAVAPEAALILARAAGGSLGAALSQLADDGSVDALLDKAARLLRAGLVGSRADRYSAAMHFGASGAREKLVPLLEAVAGILRDCLAMAHESELRAVRPEVARQVLRRGKVSSARLLEAHRHLEVALEAAARNCAPSGVVAVFLEGVAQSAGKPEKPQLATKGWNSP